MSNKIFDKISSRRPKYSAFDLSREQKLSCRFGQLVPTYLEEIVPGDNFMVKTETMMRLAPMLAPVMHRCNVYMHYFFVPNRILWNEWENFITGGKDGTSEPSLPTANPTHGSIRESKLADYLGIPPSDIYSENAQRISMLPARAYQQIWSEYFRDPNFHDPVDPENPSLSTQFALRYRCWEKDYFTSALPWPQRGPDIGVPLNAAYADVTQVRDPQGFPPGAEQDLLTDEDGNLRGDLGSSMQIQNLSEQTGIDINDLRRSTALQRWLEKAARGGYRYVEQIMAHFGVRSSDQRLQRPEYLGGGKQPIVISEVLNTTGTEEHSQGDMTGHGISAGETNSFRKSFEEHGYVLGIMSVMPKSAYQDGIDRHWLRKDKYDYYWPEFANLGEQEVKNIELYFNPGDIEQNDGTFGYQQRYAEYKYGKSSVHGDFRTNLSFWHMGRQFGDTPNLNAGFLTYSDHQGPANRVFALDNYDDDQLWVQLYHNVKARRPMPFFSDPRLS